MPVVDYEPPTRDVPRCRQSSHAPVRPTTPHITHRTVGSQGNGTRSVAAPISPAAAVPLSPAMRQAAAFSDAALRRVLEVLDRRRPVSQLRPLLTASLVDSVLSLSRAVAAAAAGQEGTAVLRRMRLQPATCEGWGRPGGPGGPENAAEVFGTFSRGDRVHAIACRVERVAATSSGSGRWLVVALHIG
ncbi:hypothetical protein BST27_00970 [Mycobacterium intermedium]|uniref:Alanine, arginine and proline rich protein n=2 Tax=Mycobacterium intermedium TaxID=28445 RepID=A0A1E3SFV6_MYCIE|nr:Rv3235 family protein [Mycobacterium intermedium]MCV6963674.1 hypothetical protein [Mycobacterium intermedium]ODR01046.1 hypothetical protein BHQ20_10140 [Mycobacterium intermedium]OPE52437.1 hypothetical protein BV508_02415 [Mycobacterium intermedium]ORB10460.1 hypothetical protein BST27_00970 [Mycobacterium intermedium]